MKCFVVARQTTDEIAERSSDAATVLVVIDGSFQQNTQRDWSSRAHHRLRRSLRRRKRRRNQRRGDLLVADVGSRGTLRASVRLRFRLRSGSLRKLVLRLRRLVRGDSRVRSRWRSARSCWRSRCRGCRRCRCGDGRGRASCRSSRDQILVPVLRGSAGLRVARGGEGRDLLSRWSALREVHRPREIEEAFLGLLLFAHQVGECEFVDVLRIVGLRVGRLAQIVARGNELELMHVGEADCAVQPSVHRRLHADELGRKHALRRTDRALLPQAALREVERFGHVLVDAALIVVACGIGEHRERERIVGVEIEQLLCPLARLLLVAELLVIPDKDLERIDLASTWTAGEKVLHGEHTRIDARVSHRFGVKVRLLRLRERQPAE